jgi:hypothetical protein
MTWWHDSSTCRGVREDDSQRLVAAPCLQEVDAVQHHLDAADAFRLCNVFLVRQPLLQRAHLVVLDVVEVR